MVSTSPQAGAWRVTEPVRVGELLASLPGLPDGWAEARAEARLIETWSAIAGPAGARSRAEGVEQGVLQIAVDSSGWLHRLTLEEPRLVARCREIVAIRGIRFRLAPPPDPAARAARSPSSAVEGEVYP
jgi:predicted nucleic acid-binding Zn ribbon protein